LPAICGLDAKPHRLFGLWRPLRAKRDIARKEAERRARHFANRWSEGIERECADDKKRQPQAKDKSPSARRHAQ
jgi:hypothetical protein